LERAADAVSTLFPLKKRAGLSSHPLGSALY